LPSSGTCSHQQSDPVAEVSASSNVRPLLDLVATAEGAHTTDIIKIIFLANNDKSFFLLAASSTC
jgi:hypothetical protein